MNNANLLENTHCWMVMLIGVRSAAMAPPCSPESVSAPQDWAELSRKVQVSKMNLVWSAKFMAYIP